MKQFIYATLAVFLIACSSGNMDKEKTYNNLAFKSSTGKMSPEALWALGRIGGEQLSPDKKEVLYTVKWYSKEENKGFTEIYKKSVDGGEQVQLTFNNDFNEFNAIWRPDGKKIGYLSSKSGSVQIWEMNTDGSDQTIISNVEGGVNGFSYSPDGKKIAFIAMVKIKDNVQDKHSDLHKAQAKIVDDLMYRHWDHWVDGKFSHIFVADFDGKSISNVKDIMEGEPWESPVRPFGGMEQVQWHPNSTIIAYVARKKVGVEYSKSTNTDIYFYNVADETTKNVTKGMMGYDKNPVFSHDGTLMAWESMQRDGYEADVNRLAIMNMESDEIEIVANDDLNVHNLAWDTDDHNIYFISNWHARDHIYSFNLLNKQITKLTEGDFNYGSILVSKDKLIAGRMSISKPYDLYLVDEGSGKATEFVGVNTPLLSQIKMGEVKERWVKTTDGKNMLVWVIYPPNFDPNKKYPALLYCQGGPQGTVSQFWSFRWNFQMMASQDYIVVAPNRRGLPGFGKEWCEQISGDYGGQNIKDYLSAIDDVATETYVDENRLGAVGASYGGFSVFYIAGHHQKRFKAFIAHDGMFNFESMYLETEEMWFVNWDIGGPFWEKDNYRAQRSYTFSPHRFVDNWDTPIMVIHGGKDYRVTESQGFMAFNAAKLKGLDAQLLYFPEENHWVLSPQNGILWQRTFFEWLDKYLK